MAVNPYPRRYTVGQYLALEQETGVKFEYIDGEIFAMAGGTENHSYITINCTGELFSKLKGSPCRPHGSDMKVFVNDTKYVYPDFSVVCGEAEYVDDKRTMLKNPTLIAEILSDSSATYDMGKKGEMYRNLPSVQIYLIIAQDRPYAQLYKRHEAGWIFKEFQDLDAKIELEAIGASLLMREIYANITFPE